MKAYSLTSKGSDYLNGVEEMLTEPSSEDFLLFEIGNKPGSRASTTWLIDK